MVFLSRELRERVQEAIDGEPGRVVDGNHVSKIGTRVTDRADLIVWLDLPLTTKIRRLTRRTARRWFRNEELWNGNR